MGSVLYANEANLSKAFKRAAIRNKFLAYRLDTAGTTVGIPDWVLIGKGKSVFVELKCMRVSFASFRRKDPLVINWQPGQQAWAMEYKNICRSWNREEYSVTLLSAEKYGVIVHDRFFEKNQVPFDCIRFYEDWSTVIHAIPDLAVKGDYYE